MTDWPKIENISNEILQEMGGNANEICNGGSARYDCTDFAKKIVTRLSKEGIRSVIIDNLNDNAMKAELDGFETEEPGYDADISHCYVKVAGWFFDAFDVHGCADESEMYYLTECE